MSLEDFKFADFNALTNNKPSFDQPVERKQKANEELIQMSGNDDYLSRNLLDHLYHQNYCWH